jgi:hypothetical protein
MTKEQALFVQSIQKMPLSNLMSRVDTQQLLIAKEKFQKAYLLLKASVEKTQNYNPDKTDGVSATASVS